MLHPSIILFILPLKMERATQRVAPTVCLSRIYVGDDWGVGRDGWLPRVMRCKFISYWNRKDMRL